MDFGCSGRCRPPPAARSGETVLNQCKAKGFTLIELLVVIAIVALLSSIVIASLATARLKARDAQRIVASREIVKALEMYSDSAGTVIIPTAGLIANPGTGYISKTGGLYASTSILMALRASGYYPASTLTDPVYGTDNYYLAYCDTTKTYGLYFRVEGSQYKTSSTTLGAMCGGANAVSLGLNAIVSSSGFGAPAAVAGGGSTSTPPVVPTTPPVTAGLVFWLDPTDVSTIIDGNSDAKIEQWRDKSTNANHPTQATASLQPTYTSASFGGRGGVAFDHIDDALGMSTLTPYGATGTSIFAVIRTAFNDNTASYAGSPGISIMGDTTGAVGRAFGVSGSVLRYMSYSGGWNNVSGGTANDGVTHVVGVVHSSSDGSISIYIDGILVGSGVIGYVQGGFGAIGNSYGADTVFGGDMGEVLVYSNALDVVSRADVMNYLVAKWK